MKSGNYHELMDKFYAGKASTEDISILKDEGLPDDQDILYAEMLNSERDQKMEWNFEDFLNKIPAANGDAVPRRRVWMKRMVSAAAAAAIILITYIFWANQYNPKEIMNVAAINKPADSNNNITTGPALPLNKVKDSVLLSENVKTPPTKSKNYTVETGKQSRSEDSRNATKDKKETTRGKQDFIVIVNGKQITDEADAIAIMRESLSMVSRNLITTVDELKPIGQIKIKL